MQGKKKIAKFTNVSNFHHHHVLKLQMSSSHTQLLPPPALRNSMNFMVGRGVEPNPQNSLVFRLSEFHFVS